MSYKKEIQKLISEIKEQGYTNICFWLPAYNVGGGTFYFVKLAQYLVKHSNFNVYFMDFPNGYPSLLLKNIPEIMILPYDENNLFFPIKNKCIIVTNSTRAIQINHMNPDNKILFWHYETTPNAWDIVFLCGEVKRFLRLTKKENAMTAIDRASFISLGNSGRVHFTNQNYLYVNLPPKNRECSNVFVEEGAINACFISRLATDKIESLYYLIREYAKYRTRKKKKLHIIGDGKCTGEVRKFCEKFSETIEFIFTGTIFKENLDDYLIKNVDILFAVGTSVLEGASLKIPSAILFVDTTSIKEHSAIMLYDSKEYCVALMPIHKPKINLKYTLISEILDKVLENKSEEGLKCYQYYIENHSNLDKLMYSFLVNLRDSTLTQHKLSKCIKYIPYALINVKKYKIIGMSIFQIVKHCNITRYQIFGITFLKTKKIGLMTKYYLCGIQFQTCRNLMGYKFPSALINDIKGK